MAADINRHLNNEPVLARPPSAAYKFQKACRRNKLAFTAVTAVALALVVGLGLAALGWRATGIERAKALQAKTQALAAKGEAEQSQRSEQQQRLQADQERERAKAGETQATRLLFPDDFPQSRAVSDVTRILELVQHSDAKADEALLPVASSLFCGFELVREKRVPDSLPIFEGKERWQEWVRWAGNEHPRGWRAI